MEIDLVYCSERNTKRILRLFSIVIVGMLIQTPVMNIGTIVAFSSISLVIFYSLLAHRYRIRVTSPASFLIALIMVSLISSLINGGSMVSPKVLIQIIMFVMMSLLEISEEENDKIQFVYCAICAIYSIFVIYSCYDTNSIRYFHGDIELFGTIIDPNYIGIPFCAASIWSFANVLENKRRWIYGVIFVINTIAILFTASRGNFIALIIPLMIVFLSWIFSKSMRLVSKVWICIVIVVCVCFLYISFANGFSLQIGRMTTFEPGSDNGRLDIWRIVIKNWTDRPLFGHGSNSMYLNQGVAAHNTYLELLYNYGLVGLLLFVGFLWKCVTKLKLQDATVAVFLSVVIQMCFLSCLDNRCFWVIISLIVLSNNKGLKNEYN